MSIPADPLRRRSRLDAPLWRMTSFLLLALMLATSFGGSFTCEGSSGSVRHNDERPRGR